MQYITIPVGPLQTNCYIVYLTDGTAAIVDPGEDADRIIQTVRSRDLSVKQIWLTHGHFDHIGAVLTLKKVLDCEILACEQEQMVLQDVNLNLSTAFAGVPVSVQPDILLQDENTFAFGDTEVTMLHTPGHTVGSCCYLVDDLLFSGDTLFQLSVGRVDFPTGDGNTLLHSLGRLARLTENYTVLPGHGAPTTLAMERMQNPYMKQEF